MSYMPALRAPLLRPLAMHGADGVPEVLELLEEYHLTKDDYDSIMELELLRNGAKASLASVSTAAKTALTRKYNQANGAAFKKMGSSKGGGAKGERQVRFTEDGEDEEAAEDDDDGEEGKSDDDDAGAFQKNPPPAKGGKAPAKAAASKGKGKAKAAAW